MVLPRPTASLHQQADMSRVRVVLPPRQRHLDTTLPLLVPLQELHQFVPLASTLLEELLHAPLVQEASTKAPLARALALAAEQVIILDLDKPHAQPQALAITCPLHPRPRKHQYQPVITTLTRKRPHVATTSAPVASTARALVPLHARHAVLATIPWEPLASIVQQGITKAHRMAPRHAPLPHQVIQHFTCASAPEFSTFTNFLPQLHT